MKKIIFILIIIIIGVGPSSSQPFIIHTSHPFYIAGEKIEYTIIPHNDIYTDSMMIVSELYSNTGLRLFKSRQRAFDGACGGTIHIPYQMNEGMYTLVIYSIWDHTSSDSSIIKYCTHYIPIYNEAETKIEEEGRFDLIIKDTLTNYTSNNQELYKFESRKKGSIRVPVLPGRYSISINKNNKGNYTIANPSTPEFDPIPEGFKIRKKLILEGSIYDPVTNKVVQEKYLSLYIPSSGYFKRINSSNGNINTEILDIDGVNQIQILSLNPNKKYPLHFVEKTYVQEFRAHFLSAPLLKKNKIIYVAIGAFRKRKMIEELFEMSESPIEPLTDSILKYKPDKSYLISDFQDIKSLEEFITEVMIDCSITDEINAIKSLRLRNKDTRNLYRWPAWYLLDGYFRGDEQHMLQFDISRIKSLDLYHRNKTISAQFDPFMDYSGIFSLNTYLQDEPPLNVYEMIGWNSYRIKKPYVAATDKPDLRTHILFKYSLHEGDFMKIETVCSDIKGNFLLEVYGFTQSGVAVSNMYSIKVE